MPGESTPSDFGSAFKDYLDDDTDALPAQTQDDAGGEGDTPPAGSEAEGADGEATEASPAEGTDENAGGEAADGADGDPAGEGDGTPADGQPDGEAGEGDAAKDAAKDAGEDDEAILQRLAGLVAKQPRAKEAPAPAPEAPAPTAEEAPLYTDDEQQALDDYLENYSEIAQGEALRRRAEYQTVISHVFKQIADVLGPRLQIVDTLAQRTHLQDLTSSIDGYNDDLVDKMFDWIDTQPAYLQTAYKQVMDQGTAADVADLYSRYQQATGAGGPSPAPVPAPKTVLPEPVKQAARSLAPVSSRRSSVSDPLDPADFSGNFARLAQEKT